MKCTVVAEVRDDSRFTVVQSDEIVGTPVLYEDIDVFDLDDGTMYNGTLSGYDEETDCYLIRVYKPR
jgi:hypothetical protein